MLTSGIIGIGALAMLVIIVGAFAERKRQRRAGSVSDGSAYMSDGVADCEGGADAGCSDGDGGGGDGGGGGGD